MPIERYGANSTGAGGQLLPFARAVKAEGWLYVSGQVALDNGVVVAQGIVAETHQTIRNIIAILDEADYELKDVVRVGVWLDDPRDFGAFNSVFSEYFADFPVARACVESRLVIDCKVEMDCVAYKDDSR